MSRKGYIAAADVIAQIRGEYQDAGITAEEGALVNGAMLQTAERFTAVFAAANPRFDRKRFFAACGYGD